MSIGDSRAASAGRVPALDGIRAIAILMVFYGHFIGPEIIARAGVHLFFLLSGYLITGILASELRSTGCLSLRRFYWRRACRILPPYALWLAVTWIVISPGSAEVGTLAALATFTTNYWHIFGITGSEPSWSFVAMTTHAWSLAVEEQFYLLWPLLLGAVGLRRAPSVLLCIAVAMLGWTTITALLGAGEQYLTRAFEVEGVWLALGCLAGLKWGARQWDVPLLSARPLAWIGAISYPLYLWHYWGAWASFTLSPILLPPVIRIPLAILLTTLLACASYYLVERPILRWRDRTKPRLVQDQNLAERPSAMAQPLQQGLP